MSRLSEIVIGLQRMAEAARDRGDDIKFSQDQEVFDHIRWLDEQLTMVDKVRNVLLEERKRFMPVSRQVDYPDNKQLPTGREKSPQEMSAAPKLNSPIPRVV